MYAKSKLDTTKIEAIKAFGGLLSFLFQSGIISRSFHIDSVHQITLSKRVLIPKNTLNALQIFRVDNHPSQIKGRGKAKEGYSVFSMFNQRVSSTPGKRLLKNWFLNPIYDIQQLENRQMTIEYFLSVFGRETLENIKKKIQKIYDIQLILRKISQYSANADDWKRLKLSIENSFFVVNIIRNQIVNNIQSSSGIQEGELIQRIRSFEDQYLQQLLDKLNNTIKINDKEKQLSVYSGINSELDTQRNIMNSLEDLVKLKVQEEYKKIPEDNKYIKEIGVCFMHLDGYLLYLPRDIQALVEIEESCSDNSENEDEDDFQPIFSFIVVDQVDNNKKQLKKKSIKKQKKMQNKIIKLEEEDICNVNVPMDWVYCYKTEKFFFFKGDIVRDLDKSIGDVQGKICEIEHIIIREIESIIMNEALYLGVLSELVAEIDVIIGYSIMALDYNLIKPQITLQQEFIIKEGRHLLAETLTTTHFVPNDYFVHNFCEDEEQEFIAGEDDIINSKYSNKCIFLTGANYSGKSIYLKQVGLIVYLTHIGSYVPATMCRIGIIDKLFALIPNEHISYDNSQTLEELSRILNLSTNRTLILLDEFGKSFMDQDGGSLLYATVKILTEENFQINEEIQQMEKIQESENKQIKKVKSTFYNKLPTSIIVTHFKELILKNMITESYILRFFTTDFILQCGQDFLSFSKETQIGNPQQETHIKQLKLEEFDKIEVSLGNDLIYLYHIKPGFIRRSFALECAKSILKNDVFMQRAHQIYNSKIHNTQYIPIKQIENAFIESARNIYEQIKILYPNI